MKINGALVRKLRTARHWSQEELATACGLNLRTIQRMESRGTGSLESVKALAAVFNIGADDLMANADGAPEDNVPFMTVKKCLAHYADFTGTADRPEYWWFFLFAMLLTAIGVVIHQAVGDVVFLCIAVPLFAVGTRRLREVGRSGWWQLLFLVPFGCVVVFWQLALPGVNSGPSVESA